MTTMQMERILLTPDKARRFLNMNMTNRRVNNTHVSRIAKDIRSGHWRLTGDSIKVDVTPQMVDGQHRCLAVIEANQAVETLLVTGLPTNARDVIDLNARPRSVADILQLAGLVNGTQKAATANAYLSYRDYPDLVWGSVSSPSKSVVAEYVMRHNDLFSAAFEVSARVYASIRLSRTVTGAASLAYGHYDEWDDFVDGIVDGIGLLAGDPRLTFRNKVLLRTAVRGSGNWPSQRNLALFVRAFQAFLNGETLKSLKFTSDNLPMPVLDDMRKLY